MVQPPNWCGKLLSENIYPNGCRFKNKISHGFNMPPANILQAVPTRIETS